MKFSSRLLSAMLLAMGLAGPAPAAIVAGNTPYIGASFGQQSDASTFAFEQTFSIGSGVVLEAIQWYGFHGADSGGRVYDQFAVLLDGVLQTGVLTRVGIFDSLGGYLYDEYTLDVADAALTATRLSIVNDSLDVEWYWQSAAAVGSPNAPSATAVAFNLVGRTDASSGTAIPEPNGLALAGMALGALALSRARIRH